MRSLLGRTAVLGASLLLLASPDVSWSQASHPVEVGSRVRVKAVGPNQRWLVGKLLEFPRDSVRLLTADAGRDSVAVALGSLANFERSRGRRSQAGKGALIGLGTGAVLGLILGVATYEECTGFCVVDFGQLGTGVLGAGVAGLFGLGVGALVGASTRTDRWEPIQRPSGSGIGSE